ncbi:MAG: hypothetical protein ISS28_03150 [Candidatus Cloacimonetes bacterium]|nr:hypothetical protein [Candidatus Cloacimonadota bacterium]MBL7086088.1 hypothetical protein [Candidatus Cloacimonadota bacterium]
MNSKLKKPKSLNDYVKDNVKNETGSIHNGKQEIVISGNKNLMINDYEEAKKNMGFIRKKMLTNEQNRTLLEAAKTEYKKKLEIWEHRVEAGGTLAKKKIDTALKAELTKIDKEHIEHLAELGVGNLEKRNRLLLKLAKITTEIFNEINNADIADFLKKDLVKRLLDDRLKLADEISETS